MKNIKKLIFVTALVATLLPGVMYAMDKGQEGHKGEALERVGQEGVIGEDVDRFDAQGITPLILAVENRNFELVSQLLSGKADVDKASGQQGITPLILAVERGNTELVSQLLSGKADVDKADALGITPLMVAICKKKSELVSQLLSGKADVDKAGCQEGITPLIMAVCRDNSEQVSQLLSGKADVDKAEAQSKTPLLLAVFRGNCELVSQLLSSKANIHLKGNNGKTAFDVAKELNDQKIIFLLQKHLNLSNQKYTFCDNHGCDEKGTKICGACKIVSYCSEKCQTAHWKNGHKNKCKRVVLQPHNQKLEHRVKTPVISEKKDDSDSTYRAQLSAAQEQLQAQKCAEKTAKSKTLVAALKDFNPDDKKTYLSLRWLIEQRYRLYGEDIKLYHKDYEQAEKQLFNKKQKARKSGSADAEQLGPKKNQKAGRAAQPSHAQDAQLRAEKDKRSKQLALEQRHGVQPACRGELPKQEPFVPQKNYLQSRNFDSSNPSSNEDVKEAGDNAEQEAAAEEQSPYLTIPYGKETLQLNIKHLFDGEPGNKGLHHDHNRQLEQTYAFAYTYPKTNRFESEDNGCYTLEITKDGETKTKSFFPSQWCPQFLRSQLIKALQNNIYYVKGLDGKTLLGVIEASDPGEQFFNPIYFKAIIEEGGIITTIYPIPHAKYNKIQAEQRKLKPEDQKESHDNYSPSAEQLEAEPATEDDMLECAMALSLKEAPQPTRPEKKQQKKRKK